MTESIHIRRPDAATSSEEIPKARPAILIFMDRKTQHCPRDNILLHIISNLDAKRIQSNTKLTSHS